MRDQTLIRHDSACFCRQCLLPKPSLISGRGKESIESQGDCPNMATHSRLVLSSAATLVRPPPTLIGIPTEILEKIEKELPLHARMMLSKTCRFFYRAYSRNPISNDALKPVLLDASQFARHKYNTPCFTCMSMRPGHPLLVDLVPVSHRQDEARNLTPVKPHPCITCALNREIIPRAALLDAMFEEVMCPHCKRWTQTFCTNCHQCDCCLLSGPVDTICGQRHRAYWAAERKSFAMLTPSILAPPNALPFGSPHVIRMPGSTALRMSIDPRKCLSTGLFTLFLLQDHPGFLAITLDTAKGYHRRNLANTAQWDKTLKNWAREAHITNGAVAVGQLASGTTLPLPVGSGRFNISDLIA